MMKTARIAMVLALVAGCEAQDDPDGMGLPLGGKADDAQASASADDEAPADQILLPLPEVTEVRATLRAFLRASADTRQELVASGQVRALAGEDECSAVVERYGADARPLCEQGRLVVPVAAADQLPTLVSGVAEVHAQPDGGERVELGLAMLLLHLPSSTLYAPELQTLDGKRTETVDVVRRIQITPQGLVVWSRDPADPTGAPLSGTIDEPPSDFAAVVLPDSPPPVRPGQPAAYRYLLALECLQEADCEFRENPCAGRSGE